MEMQGKRLYNMVRVGSNDYDPPRIVVPYTMDEMVKRELKRKGTTVDYKDIDLKCKEIDKLGIEMDKWEKEIKVKDGEEKEVLKRAYEGMKLNRGKMLSETNQLRHQKKQERININSLEEEILKSSNIIFTTLSMSGIDLIDKMDFK